MNILNYLQKIGRALMVPVAALPAAAVLMGIGYWLDPDGWGTNSQLAALLIKSGLAIIDNMAILFAVGVAFGLSKDKHGSAALSGLVGYLVVTTLLSPAGAAQLLGVPVEQVPAAFTKINNQFVGILVGVISAELYNAFHQVELPKALAFFSGKRLVPIIVSIVMIALSYALLYVWPAIFGGLVSFGETIKDMGTLGAGIYGFFNRLLIPVGLHHALNSVFWFDVAGINDIPNFLGGAKSIAEGTGVVGVTGMYQAGFFPVMMFGLPAAALAIYHSAKPAKKAQVASIMFAAALASFFTGITEPLEFAFMFVAPILYLVHALLMGLSVFIAASMQWIAGFGFSAGLVDLVLSSRNPLAVHWYMLIAQGIVFAIIYYVVFRVMIKTLNLKTLGREEDESEAQNVQNNISRAERAAKFIEALGGKENIANIDACITRLRLTINDMSKINEAMLKQLGSKGVVKLGGNGLQVILGAEAELVADAMKHV
ncbi:PTS system N-acetylglucosamine-specific IIB component (Glc family) /PTS system N-acetylglucosamine-specific IIC component (Glc family) [Pasteurella langaaensis DSM 22999]|uniref:PTS system N-acetylglucosamine-specific IIB component (Glc family) /PTS system N-acetylglucosamine-specific IIC component (Glc family) n=1 Tax=Alitibacter langaaensis DSM 22999 TaxID=1122935 RepID=A0A2U0T5H2_9PAST|nr:N-acetylglucosamine-specific PTS transporter subunit IIBC [Pasteurella langaaensis]PVX38835.1 PTS system N-acetylglucosamine-specific IIB component (Glc family) /PTS system N-acetylglucosamine-specific IIC component (Glc family) [Pasteurella langaaensis DSM 22999]